MAKFEKHFKGNFHEIVTFVENYVLNSSISASMEDQSLVTMGDVKVAILVFERYSVLGENRVSLNVTVIGQNDNIFVSAIASGGSQAVFFKVNRFGEQSFLNKLSSALEQYIA